MKTLSLLPIARLLSGALLTSAVWSGCAEAPFSVHSQDNDLSSLRAALATPPEPAAAGAPMVYVYAGAEPSRDGRGARGAGTIYGYDLSANKVAFTVGADVRSRFVVGGGLLVHREGESTLSIRDAATGALRAQAPLPPQQSLVGLSAAGGRVFYVTQSKQGVGRTSEVTALDQSGARLWSEVAPGSAGAPAAWGSLLAVPYRYQDVVLLDARTGAERSRIRQKDEQIGFVRATSAGLFYGVGDRGAARLDERSVTGQRDQVSYLSPVLARDKGARERIRVFLYWDGYRAEQADFSAFDRNRLLWEPAAGDKGRVALQGGLAVLHSYRFLFGVDGEAGNIRWAYAQPRHNLMAADLTDTAVVFVAQDGELGALGRKTGARVFSGKLPLAAGQQVLGATFAAAQFAPKDAPKEAAGDAPQVLQVLNDIIFDRDSSFIAVKTFAVNAVNSLPGKDATAALLKVVTADAMPQQVTRAAGEALVARRDHDVTTMLVQALSERYDYLNDKRAKGVGILAQAAAAMEAKEAVPALARQLQDPSTPPAALKEVVTALVKLGDKDAVRPLREMVLQYRSDPSFAGDPEPLKRAGEGLLKVGGEAERRTVVFIAEEPRTLAPVASYYRKLLDDTAPKPTSPSASPAPAKPAPAAR